MALTINTNISSLIAQRNFASATNALNVSIERMSTGYTINHAADNAAGYSISKMWTTQLGSIDVASSNAAVGSDLLTTAEENYNLLTTHLQRVRDLTEQASNGTYGSASRIAIQAEIVARLQEINRIASNAEYNEIKLMNGTGVGTAGIELQVGLNADVFSRIKLDQTLFSDATMKGLFNDMAGTASPGGQTLTQLLTAARTGAAVTDLTTDNSHSIEAFAGVCAGLKYSASKWVRNKDENHEARQMLGFLDDAINNISSKITQVGAAQNRVTSAMTALDVQSQNLTSSLSTLRDTDVASESSKYIQAQILQQASATLLSTANQLPSVALNLL